jgi:hypothetical protein
VPAHLDFARYERLLLQRGAATMTNIVKIILAIVILVVAWKIFKGLLGLAIGLAVVGLVIYGGAKLLAEGTKRLK